MSQFPWKNANFSFLYHFADVQPQEIESIGQGFEERKPKRVLNSAYRPDAQSIFRERFEKGRGRAPGLAKAGKNQRISGDPKPFLFDLCPLDFFLGLDFSLQFSRIWEILGKNSGLRNLFASRDSS